MKSALIHLIFDNMHRLHRSERKLVFSNAVLVPRLSGHDFMCAHTEHTHKYILLKRSINK